MKIPSLEEKGKWATLFGLIIIVLATTLAVTTFFQNRLDKYALIVLGGYIVGIVLIVLPSKLSFRGGNLIDMTMED